MTSDVTIVPFIVSDNITAANVYGWGYNYSQCMCSIYSLF